MGDISGDDLDDLLKVRASMWESIDDTCQTLIRGGDHHAIEHFVVLLLDAADRWRAFAEGADEVCRWVLLTDADRYVTTAMELRLHGAV